MIPDKPRSAPAQHIPLIRFEQERAENAWQAFAAMRMAERRTPELCDNPIWQILLGDAYAMFCEAFTK